MMMAIGAREAECLRVGEGGNEMRKSFALENYVNLFLNTH
jgi:hypothetical protein